MEYDPTNRLSIMQLWLLLPDNLPQSKKKKNSTPKTYMGIWTKKRIKCPSSNLLSI